MDLEQLRQFQAVARLNHMGRAAEELDVSQPALSQTIKRLEERYGVSLFDRVGRTVQLNGTGRVLLAHVDRALAELDDGAKAMHDLSARGQQSIALGYFGGSNAKAIPYLTRRFQGYGAAVDFGVFRGPSSQLFKMIKDGTLDFCFTTQASGDDTIMDRPLWNESLFLFVAKKHRLAKRKAVDLAEVAREPMLSLKRGSDLRAITDALCDAAGFVPNIVFEGQNNVTLRGLVAANVGVALAPWPEAVDREVVALPVRKPRCVRPIYIAWMRDRYLSQTAIQFRDFAIASRSALRTVGLEPF